MIAVLIVCVRLRMKSIRCMEMKAQITPVAKCLPEKIWKKWLLATSIHFFNGSTFHQMRKDLHTLRKMTGLLMLGGGEPLADTGALVSVSMEQRSRCPQGLM